MRGGPNADENALARYRLKQGDIVLGLDRPFIAGGVRVAQVNEIDLPALLLQRVARIRNQPDMLTEFALLLLCADAFRRYAEPIFTGISVPHLSPEQVKHFRIALPPTEEQDQIITQLRQSEALNSATSNTAQRQITLLREYRTRLISDVVTGKLDVREAAINLRDRPDAADRRIDEAIEKAVTA